MEASQELGSLTDFGKKQGPNLKQATKEGSPGQTFFYTICISLFSSVLKVVQNSF